MICPFKSDQGGESSFAVTCTSEYMIIITETARWLVKKEEEEEEERNIYLFFLLYVVKKALFFISFWLGLARVFIHEKKEKKKEIREEFVVYR